MESYILNIPLTDEKHKMPDDTWVCCPSCYVDFKMKEGKFRMVKVNPFGNKNIMFCKDCDGFDDDVLGHRAESAIQKYALENIFNQED